MSLNRDCYNAIVDPLTSLTSLVRRKYIPCEFMEEVKKTILTGEMYVSDNNYFSFGETPDNLNISYYNPFIYGLITVTVKSGDKRCEITTTGRERRFIRSIIKQRLDSREEVKDKHFGTQQEVRDKVVNKKRNKGK